MNNNNQRYYSNDPNQQIPYNPDQPPNPFSQQKNNPNDAVGAQVNNLQSIQLMARNSQYDDNEYKGLVVDGSSQVRAQFIAKVYTIMSLQMGITFLMILGCYYYPSLGDLIVSKDTMSMTPLTWICFVIAFIIEIAIFCCRSVARKVPMNYIFLLIFTVCFSTMIAAPCIICFNYLENGAKLVILAALITVAISTLLTIYAWFTTTDYSGLGQLCFVISLTMLLVCIFGLFIRSIWFQLIICGISVVVYSGYIIFDTQLIVGNHSHAFSIDDYIVAALMLYIDLAILFLRILEIMMILFGKK